jgi:flavin-binding protein dodecin
MSALFLICVNGGPLVLAENFFLLLDEVGFHKQQRDSQMSIYRVVRLIGSSSTSWEDAAKGALEEAAKHLEDLRVAEVEQLDIRMKENKVVEYRARVRASFRYHPEKH